MRAASMRLRRNAFSAAGATSLPTARPRPPREALPGAGSARATRHPLPLLGTPLQRPRASARLQHQLREPAAERGRIRQRAAFGEERLAVEKLGVERELRVL